ncbi:hypothetical protein [Streptomyces sp. NPDC020681]|uniref:hypothetical protein n=1 Tax=Streptomyces sp. NPDC020681 TaxID=3365083 RepID=UPI0037A4D9EE
MISEPELVDDEEPFGAREIPGQRAPEDGTAEESDAAETVGRADRKPFTWPPLTSWLWALGGAVVASAVWAGGLYAYERQGPDLGRYRTTRNLCVDAELKAIGTAVGKKRRDDRVPATREHTSLDMTSCWVTLGNPEEYGPADDTYPPSAYVSYSLHKQTDPGPEFEATTGRDALYGNNSVQLERVDDLGERAYFVKTNSEETPSLHVLDGQAVLTIGITPGQRSTSDDAVEADLSGIRPFMIEDMKALMARLQSPA